MSKSVTVCGSGRTMGAKLRNAEVDADTLRRDGKGEWDRGTPNWAYI